jgi:hypothetical protein
MFEKKIFLPKDFDYLESIDLNSEILDEELDKMTSSKLDEFYKPYPFSRDNLKDFLLKRMNPSLELKEEDTKIKVKLEEGKNFIQLRKVLHDLSDDFKKSEILKEKRRRSQAYKILNYTLSNFTYFDFFSFDSFEIAKNSKYFSTLYEIPEVTPELLLLSFFDPNIKISSILYSAGFNNNFLKSLNLELEELSLKTDLNSDKKSFSFYVKTIQNSCISFINRFKIIALDLVELKNLEADFDQTISFSSEVHQIFKKSSENAFKRFKTPIITPEILFITLMEESGVISDKIKKVLSNETSWYLLRYKLLKRLYKQEIAIRSKIPKSQFFFAYLLLTQFSDSDFESLTEQKIFAKTVFTFRNLLISEIVIYDFFKNFDEETIISISQHPDRIYSNRRNALNLFS